MEAQMAREAVLTVNQTEDGKIAITVKGGNEDGTDRLITLDMSKVHEKVRTYAAFHGMKQRLVDVAAMSRDTKTGLPATPTEKAEAIAELAEYYEGGAEDWNRKGASTTGAKGGFLFEALVQVYGPGTATGKAEADIRVWLDGLDDKAQAALREDDTIAPVIAAIKAKRAEGKPKVDTKAILGGLVSVPTP
jgi:hypothetical protein